MSVLDHKHKKKLSSILKQFRAKKILVIGDVGVDRYTQGLVERISPEAPVPIVLVENEALKLGLAANVADNVKVLGGIPLLVGIIGDDRFGADFKLILKKAGISDSHLVLDSTRRTILKERIVTETQQLLRVDYESLHAVSAATRKKLIALISKLVCQADAVILEDYAKGLLDRETAKEVFRVAKLADKTVSVDPNRKSDISLYEGATVLTPNTKEAEKMTGLLIRDDASLKKAGQVILKTTGAQYVVVTRGKEGMSVFKRGSQSVEKIPTFARQVYDVSGAGDTVISVLTLALSVGAEIEDAAILGNIAAGIEVGKRGTATVSPAEIISELG